ncbi:hypothetical protein ACA910_021306 [Epithemia clementina (nom. ined.)]
MRDFKCAAYALLVAVLTLLEVKAFSTFTTISAVSSRSSSTTQLAFGIPKFLTPKNESEESIGGGAKAINKKKSAGGKDAEKAKIGLSGILQLITAGAGAPFLGDFEGVDKESGKFMFSLEANNFVDEEGRSKQTQMPYFESGWVDPEDQAKADARKGQGFKFPWDK